MNKDKISAAERAVMAAVRAVIGLAVVLVFVRNAFPQTTEAVILEDKGSVYELSDGNGGFSEAFSTEIPEISEIKGIPTDGFGESDGADAGSFFAESSDINGLININTASAEELKTLDGIGGKKAEAIIAYREQNGRFSSIEEIMKVSGIGEGIFGKIRDSICV